MVEVRPKGASKPLGNDPFTEHRGLLFTVAYEMLGSTADAEDVVQESYLRWADVIHDEVRDPRAYLVRIVTRQSLNRLRTLKRQRESYVGTWLPEPLVTTPDAAEDVELADSVSFAMLVVLETLTPLERAVFLLREVFGFDYEEVARATDKTQAAVRQVASRANKHIQARRPRMDQPDNHEEIAARFFAAVTTGEVQQLMDLMAPDVVLLTDGGGKKQAALRPILGPDKVSRWFLGVTPKAGDISVKWAIANGAPAMFLSIDGQLDSVASFTVTDGRIAEIYVVRNPDKLTAARETFEVTRG